MNKRSPIALALLAACSRTRSDPAVEAGPEPEGPPPLVEAPAAASASDTPEARALRERLVRQIESFDQPWGAEHWDARVLTAMRTVPRHSFVPEVSLVEAYRDAPAPIGFGQTISQPTMVALMTEALALDGRERVLEIGTGSGYQAAVLSVLVREVYTIELVAPLGERARERLLRLGFRNVTVRIGDGYLGWPEQAPFDRVLLTAAPPEIPRPLIEQLAEGGILVAPVGDGEQDLVRWTKRGGELHKEVLGAVRFVPMVPGSEPR